MKPDPRLFFAVGFIPTVLIGWLFQPPRWWVAAIEAAVFVCVMAIITIATRKR